jgi:hypothetical protein
MQTFLLITRARCERRYALFFFIILIRWF